MFLSSSRTHVLCKYLLKRYIQGALPSQNNLVSAVMQICDKYDFNLAQYLCSTNLSAFKRVMKYRSPCGIADSVRYCPINSHDVFTVKNLLSSF